MTIAGPGGFALVRLLEIVYSSLGYLVVLGIPTAMILLGIIIWRSRLLGSWSILPVSIGALTYVAPLAGATVLYVGGSFIPGSAMLGMLLTFVIPRIVVGIAWMLLGIALLKHDESSHVPGFAPSAR